MKDLNESSKSVYTENWIKQEFTQLKQLNNRLIDEKWRLEEELRVIKQKEKIQSLLLQSSPSGTKSQGSKNIIWCSI